jgi:hypothetical protein
MGLTTIKQTEIYSSEPLVTNISSFEVETATEMLKKYKLINVYQIPAEFIQPRGNTMHSQIHKLINSVSN